MVTPTVAVIVPSYNHARFLRQRLDTILAQTYQDFELILLDDCSTDESRDILREYASHPRVTHVEFNDTNSGSTFKQWNKGVSRARGKYVWIAESDDYADPQFLATLVGVLDKEADVIFAYCRSWRASAEGVLNGFHDVTVPDLGLERWTSDFRVSGIDECRSWLVRSCSIQNASSVVFRRDVYVQIGGADERLRQCGDWKTWAAMALTGGTISYIAEPLNYRRCHKASVTENNMATPQNGVRAAERPHVIAWILRRIKPEPEVLAKVQNEMAHIWIPAVLDRRIPGKVRRNILRDAAFIDPRAYRRLLRTVTNRLYYYVLSLTYAPRHALGLNRRRAPASNAKASD